MGVSMFSMETGQVARAGDTLSVAALDLRAARRYGPVPGADAYPAITTALTRFTHEWTASVQCTETVLAHLGAAATTIAATVEATDDDLSGRWAGLGTGTVVPLP